MGRFARGPGADLMMDPALLDLDSHERPVCRTREGNNSVSSREEFGRGACRSGLAC